MVSLDSIKKTFSDRLLEFAKEANKPINEVYVKITLSNEGYFTFTLYGANGKIRVIDLQKDILKIKIDFMGTATIATHYLGVIVNGFAKELECDAIDINVTVVAQSATDNTACFALYKKTEFIRYFDIAELL